MGERKVICFKNVINENWDGSVYMLSKESGINLDVTQRMYNGGSDFKFTTIKRMSEFLGMSVWEFLKQWEKLDDK